MQTKLIFTSTVLCTRTRFEAEAQGNKEIWTIISNYLFCFVYFLQLPILLRIFPMLQLTNFDMLKFSPNQ